MEQSRHDASEALKASPSSALAPDLTGAHAIIDEAFRQGYVAFLLPPGKVKGFVGINHGPPNEEGLRILLAAFPAE